VDPKHVQAAIDRANPGDTILLKAGTFDFGDGNARSTVIVNKGVTIRGETILELDANGRPTGNVQGRPTIIHGGGEFLSDFSTESGPFRVHSGDATPVVIEGLWLDNWLGQGIVVTQCSGFKLKGCKATRGNVGVGSVWTNFLVAVGPGVAGMLEAERNFVDLMDIPNKGDEAHFFQILFTSNCQGISIDSNRAAGNIDLVCVYSNQFASPTAVSIHNNQLTTFRFPIEIIHNVNAVATIVKNDLTATGVSGAWLTGENFFVANNRVTGLWTGLQLGAPWQGFGTTVASSIVKNNTIFGSSQYGVAVWDASADNLLVGNDLSDLSTPPLPYGAAYFFDAPTHGNVAMGVSGTVIDNGTNFIVRTPQ
jgi:hypothetical protein